MDYIFLCSKCGAATRHNSGSNVQCSKCGAQARSTGYSFDEWYSLRKAQREDVKKALMLSSNSSETFPVRTETRQLENNQTTNQPLFQFVCPRTGSSFFSLVRYNSTVKVYQDRVLILRDHSSMPPETLLLYNSVKDVVFCNESGTDFISYIPVSKSVHLKTSSTNHKTSNPFLDGASFGDVYESKFTDQHSIVRGLLPRDEFLHYFERLRQAYLTYQQENSQNETESQSYIPSHQNNPYERMKQLKSLLDSGIISQEDFERKKHKLLEEL